MAVTLLQSLAARLRAVPGELRAFARAAAWSPIEGAALRLLAASNAHAGDGTASSRVLIVRHRDYAAGHADPSTEAVHLEYPLQAMGQPFSSFFWESLAGALFKGVPLWRRLREARARALVLSSYGVSKGSHPTPGALRAIRSSLGIPIVAIWWDTCTPGFLDSLKSVIDVADIHVIVDNPSFDLAAAPHIARHAGRFLILWPPCEASFYDLGLERDVSVSFSGQTSSYRADRAAIVEALRGANRAVVQASDSRAGQGSYTDYIRLLNRSRMAVNISASVDRDQLKARVIEILLSGAMLLESRNVQTASYFSEGQDYVAYESAEDLLEKVCYFEQRPAEREAIARAGREKARNLYSGGAFWRRVLERLQ